MTPKRPAGWLNEFFGSEGGYQINLAKTAIANGEIFGVGPGNSLQRNYLPEMDRTWKLWTSVV